MTVAVNNALDASETTPPVTNKAAAYLTILTVVVGAAAAAAFGMRDDRTNTQPNRTVSESSPIAAGFPYVIIDCGKAPSAVIPRADFKRGDLDVCGNSGRHMQINLARLGPFFKQIAAEVGIDERILFNLYNHETPYGLVSESQVSTTADGSFQIVGPTGVDVDKVIARNPSYQTLIAKIVPRLPNNQDGVLAGEESAAQQSSNHKISDPIRDAVRAAVYIKMIEQTLSTTGHEVTPTNVLVGYVFGPRNVVKILDALKNNSIEPIGKLISVQFLKNNNLLDLKISVDKFYGLYNEAYHAYNRTTSEFFDTGRVSGLSVGIVQMAQALTADEKKREMAARAAQQPHSRPSSPERDGFADKRPSTPGKANPRGTTTASTTSHRL